MYGKRLSVGNVFVGCLAIVLGWGGPAGAAPGPAPGAAAAEKAPSSFRDEDLKALDGRRVPLAAPDGGASALIFYSTECPISNAYSPTLAALVAQFRDRAVRWVGVCVDPDLSDAEVRTHARDFHLGFPVARDRRGVLARKLGASKTPEAFVLDDQGRVRYFGRIDDQNAARRVRNGAPSTHELRDAIAAVLDGKDVAVEHVAAVGCPIPEPVAAADREPITYTRDVAPIVQKHCLECHRRGQVAPFALENYEQARKRAGDIATVVDDRLMPPWKANPHVGPGFRDVRALSEKDIATLIAWSESGAKEGDPRDLPEPPKFSEEWQLGEPDLVLDIGADFAIPASGDDIYRCFVVPTNLPADRYVTTIEYRPGNRRVVHHLLAFVDVSGEARKRDAADPGPGYACFSGPGDPIHGDLGGWAPGIQPDRLPEGVGRSLPRGADVIVQVHYHPSGKPETDHTRIGLHFARKPIRQTLHWALALNPGLELPPGQSNVEIKAAWPAPVDLIAYGVTPHMHLLGRDIAMSLAFPDGRKQDLIKIDDWDFNWQSAYFFEEPIEVPKGTVLHVVGHYDNSADNPNNRNKPPKLVKWGEATTDEMLVGFLAVTKKGQDLTRPGEKDDLLQIFEKQRQEYREKHKRAIQEAQERDRKERERTRAGAKAAPAGK